MGAVPGIPAGGNVITAPFQTHSVPIRVAGGGGDIGKEVIAAGLPGHAGGETGDNRSVVDELNRPALPGGGRAPLIHSPDADGMGAHLIIAVLLVLAAPFQMHSVPVRVRGHGAQVGVEAPVLHVPGGVGGKALNDRGGVGHGDVGKGAGQVARIVPDGGGDGIGPFGVEGQIAAVVGEEAGVAVQGDGPAAQLHAPAHGQTARAADTHGEFGPDMDGIGGGDGQRRLEDDGNALAGGGGLAIAVPEGGGQGVLAGFGEDHSAAVIVQVGEVNQAGRSILLSGPCDNRPVRVKELIHDHGDPVAHILHIRHGELQGANGQNSNGVAGGEGPAQAVPQSADQPELSALGKLNRPAQVVEVPGDIGGEVCGLAVLLQGPLHRQLNVIAQGPHLHRLAGVDLPLHHIHLQFLIGQNLNAGTVKGEHPPGGVGDLTAEGEHARVFDTNVAGIGGQVSGNVGPPILTEAVGVINVPLDGGILHHVLGFNGHGKGAVRVGVVGHRPGHGGNGIDGERLLIGIAAASRVLKLAVSLYSPACLNWTFPPSAVSSPVT